MKRFISVLLLVCMAAACAFSVPVAGETAADAAHLTFNSSVTSYLSNYNSTTATVVDDDTEAGHSLKLSLAAPYTDPYVLFSYSGYVRSLGLQASAPKADEIKYILFKIKQQFCSNNVFEIFYCTSGGVMGPTGGYSVVSSFVDGDENWQYVKLNMSGAKGWSGTIYSFRIDWMLNGNGDGENIMINEMLFLKNDDELNEIIKPVEQGSADDLHALTSEQQRKANALINGAVETAPEVSNDPVAAEYEDSSLVMWFDHSYHKTPGETVTSNGQNTYQMRLAKNEIECAQMVLASKTAREGLTVEVTDFVNGEAKLTPRLYYGYYFDNVEGQSIVDPIPELRDPIDLKANRSQMFLIKVKTDKDSPAGQYKATLTVKDKDGKEIKKAYVYAYVWDFTLPDASNVKTLADLGWYSIYAMDNVNGTLYGDDDGCKCGEDSPYHAHSGLTYKNYYDMLLENKINAYGMPYVNEAQYGGSNSFEIETVKAYLDDPRVQAFNPIGYSKAPTTDNITRAKNFLSQKAEWLEKAYFYTVDEPANKTQLDRVRSDAQLIKSIWGDDYKLITPMHLNGLYDREYKVDAFEYVNGYVTVWCPHTFFFNTAADKQANPALTYRGSVRVEENLGTFPERMAQAQENGEEVWWYVTRYPHYPEITLSISDPGVDHRIFFWQQKLYNVDGFLYYSVNDWYQKASDGTWGWDAKKEVSTDSYTPYTVYGNGVLVYHGGKIGRIHEPVEALRLEQVRDGIEDYDYFVLLDEKYGEGTSDLLIKQVTTSLGSFKSDEELFTKIRLAAGNLIAGEMVEIPEPLAGDVNGDEKVNNKDVVALFRFVSGAEVPFIDENAADCNGDGKTNNKDVVILFRYVSGEDVTIVYNIPEEEEEEEKPEVQPDYYEFDRIKVVKPQGYTFKNFSGLPSGLKDGEAEGTCFFNFQVQPHIDPYDESGARALLTELARAIAGVDYELQNFSSYEVDGVPVTKIDYIWSNGAILQSIVRVYFDTGDVLIQFGVLSTIPDGVGEFDDMINTLKVK
ncbi:MAG: DUF4091 domain-containing protein [Clostridia bacterium]|nr:DUF4091 domain-containing protein [Clostridia bacterium]